MRIDTREQVNRKLNTTLPIGSVATLKDKEEETLMLWIDDYNEQISPRRLKEMKKGRLEITSAILDKKQAYIILEKNGLRVSLELKGYRGGLIEILRKGKVGFYTKEDDLTGIKSAKAKLPIITLTKGNKKVINDIMRFYEDLDL